MNDEATTDEAPTPQAVIEQACEDHQLPIDRWDDATAVVEGSFVEADNGDEAGELHVTVVEDEHGAPAAYFSLMRDSGANTFGVDVKQLGDA